MLVMHVDPSWTILGIDKGLMSGWVDVRNDRTLVL